MPDLTDKTMASWLDKLPPDIRAAVAPDDAASEDEASADDARLSAALAAAAPWQVPDVVREHADAIRGLGRARRVRLMAWVARATYPESGAIFRRLTGQDIEEGEVGGAADVGVLFLEDIRALAEALSSRLARRMTSVPALDAMVQAAVTLESDLEYRQGGVV